MSQRDKFLAGFIMLYAVDSGAIWLNGSSVALPCGPRISLIM